MLSLKRTKGLQRTRMKRVGKRGRANQATARGRRLKAWAEGWLVCEIGPLLRERGLTESPCGGEITLCHSLKTEARRQLIGEAREQADDEVAGGCTAHHYYCLDLQASAVTAEIVREAIARRSIGNGRG